MGEVQDDFVEPTQVESFVQEEKKSSDKSKSSHHDLSSISKDAFLAYDAVLKDAFSDNLVSPSVPDTHALLLSSSVLNNTENSEKEDTSEVEKKVSHEKKVSKVKGLLTRKAGA